MAEVKCNELVGHRLEEILLPGDAVSGLTDHGIVISTRKNLTRPGTYDYVIMWSHGEPRFTYAYGYYTIPSGFERFVP